MISVGWIGEPLRNELSVPLLPDPQISILNGNSPATNKHVVVSAAWTVAPSASHPLHRFRWWIGRQVNTGLRDDLLSRMPPVRGGRDQIGMLAAIKSVGWPRSRWNGGRDQIGISGRLAVSDRTGCAGTQECSGYCSLIAPTCSAGIGVAAMGNATPVGGGQWASEVRTSAINASRRRL
jgi:hypothetical protein